MRSICTFLSTSQAPDVAPSGNRFGDISRIAIEIRFVFALQRRSSSRVSATLRAFLSLRHSLASIPDHSEVAGNCSAQEQVIYAAHNPEERERIRASGIFRFRQDAIATLITNEKQTDSFTRAAKIHTCVRPKLRDAAGDGADWFR